MKLVRKRLFRYKTSFTWRNMNYFSKLYDARELVLFYFAEVADPPVAPAAPAPAPAPASAPAPAPAAAPAPAPAPLPPAAPVPAAAPPPPPAPQPLPQPAPFSANEPTGPEPAHVDAPHAHDANGHAAVTTAAPVVTLTPHHPTTPVPQAQFASTALHHSLVWVYYIPNTNSFCCFICTVESWEIKIYST